MKRDVVTALVKEAMDSTVWGTIGYTPESQRARTLERVVDKILDEQGDIRDGLESDLFEAVQVAYQRGAKEWAAMNYPKWIDRLKANEEAEEQRNANSSKK